MRFPILVTGVLVCGAVSTGCAGGVTTSGSGGAGGATTTSTTGSSGSTTGATTVGSTSASSTSASSTSVASSSSSTASASSTSASSSSSSSTSASTSASSSSSGGGPTGLTFTGLDYTAQYGNATGGQAHDDACPAGQVVTGYMGYLHPNGYHGQLQAQCGIPSVSGSASPYTVTIAPGAVTPLEGLQGVPPQWMLACPANQVVVGFSGRSGALLDNLSADCAPLSITGSAGNYTVVIGAITSLPGVGDLGGSVFPDTPCPAGEVSTDTHLRAGDGIDYFGIGCSTPVVTP